MDCISSFASTIVLARRISLLMMGWALELSITWDPKNANTYVTLHKIMSSHPPWPHLLPVLHLGQRRHSTRIGSLSSLQNLSATIAQLCISNPCWIRDSASSTTRCTATTIGVSCLCGTKSWLKDNEVPVAPALPTLVQIIQNSHTYLTDWRCLHHYTPASLSQLPWNKITPFARPPSLICY